jgi:hypothetical protein
MGLFRTNGDTGMETDYGSNSETGDRDNGLHWCGMALRGLCKAYRITQLLVENNCKRSDTKFDAAQR